MGSWSQLDVNLDGDVVRKDDFLELRIPFSITAEHNQHITAMFLIDEGDEESTYASIVERDKDGYNRDPSYYEFEKDADYPPIEAQANP